MPPWPADGPNAGALGLKLVDGKPLLKRWCEAAVAAGPPSCSAALGAGAPAPKPGPAPNLKWPVEAGPELGPGVPNLKPGAKPPRPGAGVEAALKLKLGAEAAAAGWGPLELKGS